MCLDIENFIIGFMSDNDYKCVIFSFSIFPEIKSAKSSANLFFNTFKEGWIFFTLWKQKPKKLFPGWGNLFAGIPLPIEPNFGKLYDGAIMSHRYNKEYCQCKLLVDSIKAAKEIRIKSEELQIFELDYW